MFQNLQALPPDPLLGLITAFQEDPRDPKVDLGVGVYRDDAGQTPIMRAISEAAKIHLAEETSKSYINPAGAPGFVESMMDLNLGDNSDVISSGRISGIQTPGGCGALRIGAELLKRLDSPVTIWVSDPTWANHIPLLSAAGHEIKSYPYFDSETGLVNFDAMAEKLKELGEDDVVLLHGCCHNPTGADLSLENWREIANIAAIKGFLPFIDIAYQGLGDDLETDVAGVRMVSESVSEMMIATSCSKNFGLYRDRVGSILVQTGSSDKAIAAVTQLKDAARASYSMPPAYGGYLVNHVMSKPELKAMWQDELAAMAGRVKQLRQGLLNALNARNVSKDFSFITQQKGMFSYLGITPEQIHTLREEYAIYMAGSSRINVAGLTTDSIDYVADAIKAVHPD
ncbi:MAG: aspartate/tyrosine/aromatic aminotransferase [Gammaproteobacteria bacterium]|nr:aspartate/tyrosine/aromatic aminotransferase [Gammaproteobacteria bacterium]NNJ73233.1 aspartate/tyrosine/aromatic aminotransferase [Enterobacterales bacterium]